MTPLHLDTPILVWLYEGDLGRIPASVRARLDTEPLRYSPMVRLELAYLNEIGRIAASADRITAELENALALQIDATSFDAVSKAAAHLEWTRDPFDRVIAAQALAGFGTLVTSDRLMREKLPDYTQWD